MAPVIDKETSVIKYHNSLTLEIFVSNGVFQSIIKIAEVVVVAQLAER